MAIRVVRLDLLKNLEDFRVILWRMAIVRQWKAEQKMSWEDQVTAVCQVQLRPADQLLH
jgi:hypothetical protein